MTLKRVDLTFTARNVVHVIPKLIGGTPSVGIELKVQQADPEDILSALFEHFGKDTLIEFLED